jgi:hypothetical protein
VLKSGLILPTASSWKRNRVGEQPAQICMADSDRELAVGIEQPLEGLRRTVIVTRFTEVPGPRLCFLSKRYGSLAPARQWRSPSRFEPPTIRIAASKTLHGTSMQRDLSR